jgi:hypothetical protein
MLDVSPLRRWKFQAMAIGQNVLGLDFRSGPSSGWFFGNFCRQFKSLLIDGFELLKWCYSIAVEL